MSESEKGELRPASEPWKCPVCKGGVQMSMDLYLSAMEGKAALEQEVKVPLSCSNGHRLHLSLRQQAELVERLGADWTPQGRAQA